MTIELDTLPGSEFVIRGIEDLRAGEVSVFGLLVLVGAPRLRRAGLDVPHIDLQDLPEHLLYQTLARENPETGYARYNSLIRRLVSFESAYEQLVS